MSKNDGGPAFPDATYVTEHGDEIRPAYGSQGMSLRDWFAGQALHGFLANGELRPGSLAEIEHMSMRLYQVADAMLAARDPDQ